MNPETHLINAPRDAVQLLWRGRTTILLVAVAATVIAALVSLLLPQRYEARATILPVTQSEGGLANQLAAASQMLPSGILSVPSTPVDIYREMLDSRTVREGVVRRLGLIDRYGIDAGSTARAMEVALSILGSQTRIAQKRSGLIAVDVAVHTPALPFLHRGAADTARALAAAIANEFTDQLDRVQQERGSSRARNSRLYLEEQLETTRRELEAAAESLAAFQREHATLSVDVQARVALETLGTLRGGILAKEVEVDVLEKSRTPESFEVQRARSELAALKERYRQLQYGEGEISAGEQDYYVPIGRLPGRSMRLRELAGEVKVKETVYTLLTQQYHQARIEEARDFPTVQVLDEAVPPAIRAAPKRRIIVALALLGGLIAGAAWVLIRSRPAI